MAGTLALPNVISGLTDRVAYQTEQLTTTFAAISATGGGTFFQRATADEVYEPERDFLTPSHNLDIVWSGTVIFPAISALAGMVNAFDTHTQNVAGVTFDTYLTNSGVHVADGFATVYQSVRNTALSAINVFKETDIVMGQITSLGSGTWVYTAGVPLGTGSGTFSSSNHTAQQLLAYLGSGVTIGSGVTVGVTVSATKPDLTTGTVTVNFTGADPANTHRAIGTSSNVFLQVTNMTAVGVDNSAPTIFVRNLRERVPGL